MEDDNRIIVAGFGGGVIRDKALMRRIRGPVWSKIEPGFFAIMFFSLALHGGLIYLINRITLNPKKTLTIEQIPDRLVRFVVERPIPKIKPGPKIAPEIKRRAADVADGRKGAQSDAAGTRTESRIEAQKNAASRQTRVENKIRTAGVLGLLTGIGTTAVGPAVVDVLGANGNRKERNQDLELALMGQSGLIKTDNAAVLERKLVHSKDVDMAQRREEIDDLLDMGGTATRDLIKTGGDIVIRPPESIEGAASSNALRSERSIGDIVSRYKNGIKLTYGKFLRRDPGISGKITVRFTISAAGTITNVIVLENTTGNQAFEQEIVKKIKLWKFEAVLEGDATVTYPFLFNPS